jgi:hypothetical protein
VKQPTRAQFETLAAWWFTKGSNRRAAKCLDLKEQTIKTELWHLRQAQQAATNVDLVMRFMDELDNYRYAITEGRRAA